MTKSTRNHYSLDHKLLSILNHFGNYNFNFHWIFMFFSQIQRFITGNFIRQLSHMLINHIIWLIFYQPKSNLDKFESYFDQLQSYVDQRQWYLDQPNHILSLVQKGESGRSVQLRPSNFILLDRPVLSLWTVYFYSLRPSSFIAFWISGQSTLSLLDRPVWFFQFQSLGPSTLTQDRPLWTWPHILTDPNFHQSGNVFIQLRKRFYV